MRIHNYIKTALLVFLLMAQSVAQAQTDRETDRDSYADQAVNLLSDYLKVDTVNPPGNESRAVAYFAEIFKAHGIPYDVYESVPGRANIVARLKGGSEPGLILLNHTDVVPFDADRWDHPPLSGKIANGMIYGRGAVDMKNVGIIQLQWFLWLHKSGLQLNRDVMFVAVADEEAGGNVGAGYLVKEHRDVFNGMGYLLNEGGSGRSGKPAIFSIGVMEKFPLWLKLSVEGEAGHGSAPIVDGAVNKLIAALDRLQNSQQPVHVLPLVEEYFRKVAPQYDNEYRGKFENIEAAVKDPKFIQALRKEHPRQAAQLSNTCSITRLGGSTKTNVIPNSAWAELDCRLLPGQDVTAFKQWLTKQLGDASINIEDILTFPPATSSMDNDLFKTIAGLIQDRHPGAITIPSMTTGFTDSHWFREIDIVSYGFTPIVADDKTTGGFHGNNERIGIDVLKTATKDMIELLNRFVVVE